MSKIAATARTIGGRRQNVRMIDVEDQCREQFLIVNRVGRYADMPDGQYLEAYQAMVDGGLLRPVDCTDIWDEMQEEYGEEIAAREDI